MSNLKRYLVFRYDSYYPAGGWSDFKESFDTWEEAFNYIKTGDYYDSSEIVDIESAEVQEYTGRGD